MIVKLLSAAFSKGVDYGLRSFPLPHGDALRTVQTLDWTDAQGHPTDAAPIMDSEAEDPVLRLPADSAEGELLESTVLDSSYLQVSWGPRQDDERAYFIMGVTHSGTAPDDWWELRLRLDPFAHLEASANIRGRWDATPDENETGMTFAVSSDTMVMIPEDDISNVHFPRLRDDMYIVKISSTEYVTFDNVHNTVDRQDDTPTTYYALVNGRDIGADVTMTVRGSSINHYKFPSLYRIIGDIDRLAKLHNKDVWYGLTASKIVDVSISDRAPYLVNEDNLLIDSDGYQLQIYRMQVTGEDGDLAWIVKQGFDRASRDRTALLDYPFQEYEKILRYCGSAGFYDGNDSLVASLDPSIIPAREKLTLHCVTYSDVTGLYTEVSLEGLINPQMDVKATLMRFTVPEGKIPYVGSNWGEYAAAQRSYDRENMTLAIQNARSEMMQGTAMSIANGALTGSLVGGGAAGAGTGALTAGLGIAGDYLSLQRNERTSRKQQDLKEKLIRSSPGTPYNTGYGMDYIRKTLAGRDRMQWMLPRHLTPDAFSLYVGWHGYPAGGLESIVTLKKGYIQGYITDMTYKTKRERDRMNRELTEGVRFI